MPRLIQIERVNANGVVGQFVGFVNRCFDGRVEENARAILIARVIITECYVAEIGEQLLEVVAAKTLLAILTLNKCFGIVFDLNDYFFGSRCQGYIG